MVRMIGSHICPGPIIHERRMLNERERLRNANVRHAGGRQRLRNTSRVVFANAVCLAYRICSNAAAKIAGPENTFGLRAQVLISISRVFLFQIRNDSCSLYDIYDQHAAKF